MRWIRLDLSWSHSQWLSVMSAESRLAWVELLCYIKGFGTAGRARSMAPARFAHMIYVGEEAVRQMLNAAEAHGALKVVEGDWLIVKWMQYQGDEGNAARQARFRDNQKERGSNGSNALRNEVTTTLTETLTETINPLPPKGEKSKPKVESLKGNTAFQKPTILEVEDYMLSIGAGRRFARKFFNYNESKSADGPWLVNRSPMKDWRASCRTWKDNALDRGESITDRDDDRPATVDPSRVGY